MMLRFPHVFSINHEYAKNPVRQITACAVNKDGELLAYSEGRLNAWLFCSQNPQHEILILPPKKQIPDGFTHVLRAGKHFSRKSPCLDDGVWLQHPLLKSVSANIDHKLSIAETLESWIDAFSFVGENPSRGVVGLRTPQLGAVHAVHAHWAASNEPGTIVMPTGTGKTETMLAVLVSTMCPKLLVIVPTDALRTQLSEKFLTLGFLKAPDSALLHSRAKTPVVCSLQHVPRTANEVDDIFSRSHVIVTTSSIAAQSVQVVQEQMAALCPYLFIDEAHHAEAPTWSAFKQRFADHRILQFTATPYREDGKLLDGTIIFKYPLQKAQQEGYFEPIRFMPVTEFNRKRQDKVIAEKAVAQLRKDKAKGHILMARVENVARAKEVFELYKQYAEFNPVQLHTGIKSKRERDATRQKIVSKEARIIVCVDMLGEGFDLPELKIAAFHDIRKTLAVTLQLAGRFTRARPDLGEATFIANTADVDVRDELRKLYARDPDWNVLLPELSDRVIGEQVSLQQFLSGFTDFSPEISLKAVRPALSTVVYHTKCSDWTPENFGAGLPGIGACAQVHHSVNQTEHTLAIVTAHRVRLPWADLDSLYGWEWELYIVIWSPEQNLLFINASTNSSEFAPLARAVAGDDVQLIQGQQVFRVFAGIGRLRLQNVGLTEQLGRNIRYTGRMGSDIEPALPGVQRGRARKSVLSGTGYEGGSKATVGASRKGRIWTHRRDRIDQLAAWCKTTGTKLLDESIDPDTILQGTLEAKTLLQRPAKMPIYVDWPEEICTEVEASWIMAIDGHDLALDELELELIDPGTSGNLKFAVKSEAQHAVIELELLGTEAEPDYQFKALDGKTVTVRRGEHAEPRPMPDYFYYNPPMIWFVDGSALEGNQYVELKTTQPPYNPARLQDWDWAGTNIRSESQGKLKSPESIQARVIRELSASDYDVLFDDDGSGEAADVVAIRVVGGIEAPSQIEVEFYHCKYSHDATPGQRIEDLYEVCGQAQKSISWMSSPEKFCDLFTHFLRREARRQEAEAPTRFEKGDSELLQTVREISRVCPVTLRISIVQPGLSKAKATRDQLQLLSVTENHLMETYQIPFGVISSA